MISSTKDSTFLPSHPRKNQKKKAFDICILQDPTIDLLQMKPIMNDWEAA